MTNLPITSNNSKPSTNVANTAQKDGSKNMQPADQFGAVLARQMDEANAPASNMSSSAAGADTKTVAGSAGSTDKTEQDKTPTATSASGDLSGALAVMLQIPQEIKTTVTKDAASSASQSNTRIDLTNSASNKSDSMFTTADSAAAGAGKAAATLLTDNIGATQADAKIDLTTAASGKAVATQADAKIDLTTAASGKAVATQADAKIDLTTTATSNKTEAAVMATDSAAADTRKPGASKSGVAQLVGGASQVSAKIDRTTATSGKSDVAISATDKPALLGGAGPEITKSTELPNSPLSAAPTAHDLALSTATMTASSITPGMLTNNKIADNLQTISSPLGSSGWSDEFSQKISWMSSQRNQVAELHLNPPNLGPLDVVLKISDNQATAMFTSPHGAVRDAVENALPRLREMLADNGITLGNTTVSDQPPRDRNADRFLGNDSGTATQRDSSGELSRLAGLSPAVTQPVQIRRHNGIVDTFA